MALTRKPHHGDILTFKHAPTRWRVLRCDGNICWIESVDRPNDKPSCFIWFFPRDNEFNNQATLQA